MGLADTPAVLLVCNIYRACSYMTLSMNAQPIRGGVAPSNKGRRRVISPNVMDTSDKSVLCPILASLAGTQLSTFIKCTWTFFLERFRQTVPWSSEPICC